MKALVKTGPGPGGVELRDVPDPVPGPGEVVLEVAAAGICGTDLHILDDEFPTEPPVVMGHEVAGRVVALGPGVPTAWEGERVTTETYASTCGRCAYCRDGHINLCPERRSIGSKEDGGFARFLRVPARNLHALPANVDDRAGALAEPLACVAHAVQGRPTVAAGDLALIVGPGAIGLLTLQVARATGATTVVLGTRADAARLDLARRLGADRTVTVEDEDVAEAVRDASRDGEGADVAYECSGAGPAALGLPNLVRRRGRYVQVGLFGRPVPWDLDALCYRELTATGSNASTPASWRRALALLRSGAVDTGALVSHVHPLESWREAFEAFRAKSGVKGLFVPTAGDASRP